MSSFSNRGNVTTQGGILHFYERGTINLQDLVHMSLLDFSDMIFRSTDHQIHEEGVG